MPENPSRAQIAPRPPQAIQVYESANPIAPAKQGPLDQLELVPASRTTKGREKKIKEEIFGPKEACPHLAHPEMSLVNQVNDLLSV